MSRKVAGHHRAARTEDGGQVQARGGDEHSGHDFVAVGNHHKGVKLVGLCDALNAVGDKLAGDERVLHSLVAHRDSVANADGREFYRGAACHADSGLDGFGDFVQLKVAGNYFVFGAANADQRAVKLFVGVAHRVKKASVGSAGGAFCGAVAFLSFGGGAFRRGLLCLFCSCHFFLL